MNYSRFCYLSISDRHSYHVYSDTLFTIVRSDMKIKKFPENVVDQLDFQAIRLLASDQTEKLRRITISLFKKQIKCWL